MIITCSDPTCQINQTDQMTQPVRLWECTLNDSTVIRCTDHAAELDTVGWTCRRIRTDDDAIAERAYASVGVN